MVPAAVTEIQLFADGRMLACSLTALIPALPAVMTSPDEVTTEMLPTSVLNARMPLLAVEITVALAATLTETFPVGVLPPVPPSACASMPFCTPETVVPELSLTVMSPFPKLKALMPMPDTATP